MRIKLPKSGLEILFLECSRPMANMKKFIFDWAKLVQMCKDAHKCMAKFMTEDQLDQLQSSTEGNEFLKRLFAVPIVMINVHCLEARIAVLDRPYSGYFRVRMIETFTIPLRPLESPQPLVTTSTIR